MGLGAGVLGALFVALKYAVRPADKSPLPDAISPTVFRTKVLHTSLGQMVYHECGVGPTLIFVHGIWSGASSYEWSKVYPQFTGTHRVLAPDLVGFGESARPDSALTASDYARSLAEFVRATCDAPPVLIGSGLGAGFCVLLASQHPELAARLILLMPTGLTEFDQRHYSLSTRLTTALPVLHRFLYRNYQSTRSAMRTWLASYGFADPFKLSDEVVDVYTTCAQQYGTEYAIRNLHAGRLSFDLEGRIKTLTLPITLLWSDAASLAPLEWAERLKALVPASSLIVLKNVAQLAAIEAPDQVTEALREQLQTELRVFRSG